MYSGPQDTRVLTGVMDQDSAAWAVAPENYRYALNLVSAYQNQIKSRSNVPGNIEIVNQSLYNGVNRCLGYFEDIKGSSVIFMVYNSLGYHAIFRWYENVPGQANGAIQAVYQVKNPSLYDKYNKNPLNFTQDSLITGINLSGDVLSWVDNQEPRSCNIATVDRNFKKFIYNIYLGQRGLEVSTQYDLTFSSTAQPLVSGTPISVTLNQPLLQDRCVALTLAINTSTASNYMFATNKYDYVQIEAQFFGDFFVSIQETNVFGIGQTDSKAIVQNIYPDYRGAFLPSLNYRPMEQWHVNMIKSPLFMPLKTRYTTRLDNLQDNVYANIDPFVGAFVVGASTYSIVPGSSNDSTGGYYDNFGEYTLGATVAGTAAPTSPNAFFLPGFNVQYSAELLLDIEVSTTSGIPFRIAITYANANISVATANAYTSKWFTSNNIGDSINDFNFTWQSSASTTAPVYPIIFIQWDGTLPVGETVNINLKTGFVKYWDADTSQRIDVNTPYVFRAKYIFRDYKHSVYSAYSVTPKPVTYKENVIEVSLDDKWMSDQSYVALIQNVVLAYSDDAGATWHDFALLYQKDFLTSPVAYFYGRNFVRTVPSSEAALQFHAVPVKAVAQEFVDQRIFYSEITEGYDLTPIDLKMSVDYVDVNQESLYPSTEEYNYSRISGNYGSFWERGYQGSIGIVYMDDYDRKSFVNLSDSSELVTRFWSQNISGVLRPTAVPLVSWQVNNAPPGWATKYHFVRTKNIRTDNFIEWTPLVKFADQDLQEIPYQYSLQITGWSISGSQTLFDIQVNGVSIMSTTSPPTVDDGNFASIVVSEVNSYVGAGAASFANGIVYINPLMFTFPGPYTSFTVTIGGASTATTSTGVVPATFVALDFGGLGQYNERYNAKLSFTYVQGDYVIFKDLPYEQWQVKSVAGDLVYIESPANYPIDATIPHSVQVYSQSVVTENLYYEFGQCYEIYTTIENGILKKYHRGQTQDQTGTQPATGTWGYGYGNVWYRDSVDQNTTANQFPDIDFGSALLVQRMNFCDYTQVVSNNNGRANELQDIGQKYRPSAVRFSDPWIQDTEINGINAFQPANEKQYNIDFGAARKLQRINNDVLKVIFTNSVQLSIYVKQGILRQGQGGENLVSLTDSVIGDDHLIQRTLGGKNPESVVINDEGDIFGYDENEGVVWLGAGNGLLQLSDVGMKTTFLNYALHRRQLSTPSHAPAVYDLYNDYYMITLGGMNPLQEVRPSVDIDITNLPDLQFRLIVRLNPIGIIYFNNVVFNTSFYQMLLAILTPYGYTVTFNSGFNFTVTAPAYAGYYGSTLFLSVQNLSTGNFDLYNYQFVNGSPGDIASAFTPVTLAYSKRDKGWITYFSFTPEMYGRLRSKVLSFVDGKLYLHGINALHNNFYGTQYDSRLRFVMNKDYPKVKVPLSVWYRGTGKWGTIITNVPTASYPYGQETEMTENHFLLEEDGYYSEVLKNRFDPRYPTTDQAWVNGEDIRGDAPEIEFYNKETTASRLDSTKTLYLYSENS